LTRAYESLLTSTVRLPSEMLENQDLCVVAAELYWLKLTGEGIHVRLSPTTRSSRESDIAVRVGDLVKMYHPGPAVKVTADGNLLVARSLAGFIFVVSSYPHVLGQN
jgi:hypothetical protein